MLSAILIDDEADALEVLDRLLKNHCPQITRRDCFVTALGGTQAFRQRQYDLAFLDIHLQHGTNGLKLAESLRGTTTKVIFVTGHDKYALEAFRLRAVGYLLKPVDVGELKTLVTEVNDALQLQPSVPAIVLSDRKQKISVSPTDIYYVKGGGSYCEVFGVNGKIIELSRNLLTFERELDSSKFYRCHQSYLVNTDYLDRIKVKPKLVLHLKNGAVVPISVRRRQGVEEFLRKM